MHPLDPRTFERLAKIACDIEGPYERRGYELEVLLRQAGWADPPVYDGSPRIPWLTDALLERREDLAAIERFICRLCDPIEYEDGSLTAEPFRSAVNQVLEPEGLLVAMTGGRPVLGMLGERPGEIAFVVPDDLAERLERLISDHTMVDLLAKRAKEAQLCANAGAHALALIGIGSFVEGMLLAVLAEHNAGRAASIERAPLGKLIDAAHDIGWIQIDAKEFAHVVRDYRNLVHPGHQLRKGLEPDDDTIAMCWAPALAVLNDLVLSSGARSA